MTFLALWKNRSFWFTVCPVGDTRARRMLGDECPSWHLCVSSQYLPCIPVVSRPHVASQTCARPLTEHVYVSPLRSKAQLGVHTCIWIEDRK